MRSNIALEAIMSFFTSIGVYDAETGALNFSVLRILVRNVPGWDGLEKVRKLCYYRESLLN